MKSILITGGSGFVGKHLTTLLVSKGYEVRWLTRKKDPTNPIQQFEWNYNERKVEIEAFEKVDAIIHLAGANINGKRWNQAYKKNIYESRIDSTKFLFDTLSKHPHQIKKIVSASAVGYYGINMSKKILTEIDSEGNDFLAQTCADWERAILKFADLGLAINIVRTGIVFSKDSEAFKQMSRPIRFGLGASIGNGNQYFSWIHIADLCQIYFNTLDNDWKNGIYNAVAPNFINNKQVNEKLAKFYNKALWLPNIPGFVVRILFGEIADSLLKGNKISCDKIEDTGFDFHFKTIEDVLYQT